MKTLTALSTTALFFLASMPLASGQNLPASMAYTDESAYERLEFLDVTFPASEGLAVAEMIEVDREADKAARPVISHTSAAVLSLFGLLCLTGRKSR